MNIRTGDESVDIVTVVIDEFGGFLCCYGGGWEVRDDRKSLFRWF
jgi:hypothetical protein